MRVPYSTGEGSPTRLSHPYPLFPAVGLEGEINPCWANEISSFGNLDPGHEGIDKREDLLKGSRLMG